MARPSARNTKCGAETAASLRPTRTPVKSAIAGKTKSSTPSTGGKRGRPAGSGSRVEKDANGATGKKRMRNLSVAAKAKKQREAGRAARQGSGTTKSEDDGPQPEDVFNDELNNTGPEWETEQILDSKLKGKTRLYLFKWAGYEESENTWEPEVHLRNADKLIEEFDEAKPDKP